MPQHLHRPRTVPPKSARAFVLPAGSLLTIVDVEGGQPGDLVAYCVADTSERFSQSRTRVENRRLWVTSGDRLWTNRQTPRVMFEIIHDTCGRHDLTYTPCSRWALAERFSTQSDGCLENLGGALSAFGLGLRDVPDPLNLFFNVEAQPDGRLEIASPSSQPGARLTLRAAMDCIVAVSTCAVPNPDRQNTHYRLEFS